MAGLITFAVWQLPRGYDADLSRIGHGSNVAVLVHDRNGVESLTLMQSVDGIRSHYRGRVIFLIADLQSDEGRAFAARERVGAGTLVLFGPDGTRRAELAGRHSTAQLDAAMHDAFGG